MSGNHFESVPKRVVLAMSGGVDSSAAAVLLKRAGYEVIGLFMRSGATDDAMMDREVCRIDSRDNELGSPSSSTSSTCSANASTSSLKSPPSSSTSIGPLLPILGTKSHKQGCCSASDAADARRVADVLDIPFHALNFSDAFGRIKDYFVDEYLAGRTPNPCVMCNNWLKFGKLWDFAVDVGAQWIATGHYARIDSINGKPALIRGRDLTKDQSYVLAGINREILDHILFPVGNFTKPEIRDLAAEAGLRVASKPDSQEICFIPDNDYVGFLDRYRGRPDLSGEFVDLSGNVLGRHSGFDQFTIGQRRGLGITFGEPRFVVRIDPETHRVVLGRYEDLACKDVVAKEVNWLVDDVPDTFECRAQIRYQHTAAKAKIVIRESEVHVMFDEPQYGVAPGQALVMYHDNQVLG
ncbi:MAG: tRNA 2-thiouridine(34) synthase MnmA, partial [Planctomycetes bacterium]|nr:tRNA 2-thiouridine(34) synthase MnmA [Planctomycetota bacterium]